MLPSYFALIGAAVAGVGGVAYLIDTIRGKVQPNRITWILWALFPMITFVAQLVQGVGGIVWVSFVSGFTPILIVIASFFSAKAYWKTEKIDYYCLALGLIGITLWALTKNANLAILFSIFADLAAAAPTIRKAYLHPHTESWAAFGLSSIGFALGLLSIHVWIFSNYAFVAYLFVSQFILLLLAVRKPHIVVENA